VLPPDPVTDLDWPPERAAAFGEAAIGIWAEFLAGIGERPVAHRATAREVSAAIGRAVPDEPVGDAELMAYLRDLAMEHSVATGAPGFMAYVSGAGTVPGAPADLVAAAINQNVGAYMLAPGATEIELAVCEYLANRCGLPDGATGLVLPGGALANFTALKLARDAVLGGDVRETGLGGRNPLAVYASAEAHVTIDRACDMLGLGSSAVRHVPVDGAFRMRLDELDRMLAADVAGGVVPAAVVGSAGTTATGAIDPLDEIADRCAARDIWFHVDAAYGGGVVLSDRLRPLLAGIERADSITVDPHKWLYTPHSGGCLLVRDPAVLEAGFAVDPSYVRHDRALTGRGVDLGYLGPMFSRGFAALKIWVSLLAHGRAAYARRIEHDIALAEYLHRRVVERPEFEPMARGLSICCFRFVPGGLVDGAGRAAYLDLLNERLMHELQLDGRVFPSNAVLPDGYALRACIVNFRTEAVDCDALLDRAADLGAALDRELRRA
jgi:aromatic-L-amino-acid/L-tryptophan decarboxylase